MAMERMKISFFLGVELYCTYSIPVVSEIPTAEAVGCMVRWSGAGELQAEQYSKSQGVGGNKAVDSG
jgi:hypothetical protein